MNSSDIYCKFTSTDVNCYYCDTLLYKKKIGTSIFDETYCFVCTNILCQERFYYGPKAGAFSFTCKDLICAYTYKTNLVSISNFNSIVDAETTQKFIKNTIPSFEINFSNKDKLYNKLKTYLSFS
jgi:hypothetical protein